MNYLDLFSGIGGFALGAYMAGMRFENHYFSEIDPYCVELYQKRFPEAIALGDIRGIDCEELVNANGAGCEGQSSEASPKQDRNGEENRLSQQASEGWIITGGFPCQDISVAGAGAGIRGERSGLWFEYRRIIRGLRPLYAIMENVGALTFRGLDAVLGSLAEIGYDAEWQDIRAEDVGAPHRRERIWIVAYPECDGRRPRWPECEGQQGRLTSDGASAHVPDANGERLEERSELDCYSSQPGIEAPLRGYPGRLYSEVPDAQPARLEGLRPDTREPAFAESGDGGAPTPNSYSESEEWPTEPRGERGQWSVEPSVRRVADGLPTELVEHWGKHHLLYEGRLANKVPKRVDRLRGLGNAIVPQIAEMLFRRVSDRR